MSLKPITYVVQWRPDKEKPWIISPKENRKEKQFASSVTFGVRSSTEKGNIEATGFLTLKKGIATIEIDDDI